MKKSPVYLFVDTLMGMCYRPKIFIKGEKYCISRLDSFSHEYFSNVIVPIKLYLAFRRYFVSIFTK